MRLLLDENVPIDFKKEISQAGHDVEHVIYACKGKSDPEVLSFALKSKRTIVSFDADFCKFREVEN